MLNRKQMVEIMPPLNVLPAFLYALQDVLKISLNISVELDMLTCQFLVKNSALVLGKVGYSTLST